VLAVVGVHWPGPGQAHHSVDAGVDAVAPGVRGCRRSRPVRRMRRCCVVSPGDSRGAGFGVEGVSRRSRRLLVSRSRVDGLHRTGCGGVGPGAGVGTGGLGPRGAPGWVGALGMRQFVGYSRQGSLKSAGNPARRVFTSSRTRPRSRIPAGVRLGSRARGPE